MANYGDKSQYVALDSTSLELLQQTQLLLLSFGIKSKLYRNRRWLVRRSSLLPDGKGGTREYPGRASPQPADQPQLAVRVRARDRFRSRQSEVRATGRASTVR